MIPPSALANAPCTCNRNGEVLKQRGHIMGCALRSRLLAIMHFLRHPPKKPEPK